MYLFLARFVCLAIVGSFPKPVGPVSLIDSVSLARKCFASSCLYDPAYVSWDPLSLVLQPVVHLFFTNIALATGEEKDVSR